MPVTYTWLDEQARIVLYRFEGAWTWRAYDQALAETLVWFATEPHRRADVILEFEPTARIPLDFLARIHVYKRWQPNNIVRVVFILHSTQAQMTFNLAEVLRVLPPPLYCSAPSMDAALQIIAESRSGAGYGELSSGM